MRSSQLAVTGVAQAVVVESCRFCAFILSLRQFLVTLRNSGALARAHERMNRARAQAVSLIAQMQSFVTRARNRYNFRLDGKEVTLLPIQAATP
jgi:hypothetical protein